MATTEIASDIQSITGVGTASAGFIESAQRFVASSVPKELLRWAASETVPATHGGDNDPQQVTMPNGTDSIISVRRDSYVAQEVGIEDRGFIGNSTSLKKATNTFPKYFIADANRIIVKPDPDSTYKIYVTYVDYSNLDDDADLRSAIINHSSSKEFSKLSVSKLTDMVLSPLPVAPSAPSYTTPDIASVSVHNLGSAPTYTAPSITTGDTPSDSTSTDLSSLDTTSWTALDYDFDDENINPLKWFQVAGDFIQNQEDFELAGAQLSKISAYAGVYAQAMQNQLNKFNDENVEYQAKLQEAIKEADINSSEANQEANLKLQKENQEYSAKLQLYQADIAKYQNEINAQVQNSTSSLQNAAYYSAESKKYYELAVAEVNLYIQNNSKIINKTLAAQVAAGRK